MAGWPVSVRAPARRHQIPGPACALISLLTTLPFVAETTVHGIPTLISLTIEADRRKQRERRVGALPTLPTAPPTGNLFLSST